MSIREAQTRASLLRPSQSTMITTSTIVAIGELRSQRHARREPSMEPMAESAPGVEAE